MPMADGKLTLGEGACPCGPAWVSEGGPGSTAKGRHVLPIRCRDFLAVWSLTRSFLRSSLWCLRATPLCVFSARRSYIIGYRSSWLTRQCGLLWLNEYVARPLRTPLKLACSPGLSERPNDEPVVWLG